MATIWTSKRRRESCKSTIVFAMQAAHTDGMFDRVSYFASKEDYYGSKLGDRGRNGNVIRE